MNELIATTDKNRKRRGNSRFLIFFILILCVLSSLAYVTYLELCKAEWLNIDRIAITNNENVAAATLNSLLQDYYGRNLVDISADEIKDRLQSIKRIEKVGISRAYPNMLRVKIFEKKGFVYVKSIEGDLFPIDNTGMILEYSAHPSSEDLPIVHTLYSSTDLHIGNVVKDKFIEKVFELHLSIMKEYPDFCKSISEYYLDNNSVVIVDINNGARILINKEDLKNQLRRYRFVQENGDINKSSVFDLRFKNQVVVRAEVQ